MNAPRRKLPPFGNDPDIAHSGLVFVYCGPRAWRIGKAQSVPGLVFPRRHAPEEYTWPVKGLNVIVFTGGEDKEIMASLVVELLNQGAVTVDLAAPPDHDGWVHRIRYERPGE